MEARRTRFRFNMLVAAHLLLGAVFAAVVLNVTDWSNLQSVVYIGWVGAEMLLLSLWAGLAPMHWASRLGGLATGTVWLNFLAYAPALGMSDNWEVDDPEMFFLVTIPVFVLASCAALANRFLSRLERREQWSDRTVAQEFQFSLRAIAALTVVVSALLAVGRLIHGIQPLGGRNMMVIIVAIIIIQLCLGTVTLLWACLGDGRALVRVPIMFLTSLALGAIFPYYVGGDREFYVLWTSLAATVACYAAASTLIVRSCGYRLVARSTRRSEVAQIRAIAPEQEEVVT